MVESRWLRWIGPGVVALGAVGFIATTTSGAGARPWTARACVGPPAERIAAAQDPRATTVASVRGAPWFRLDPVLDGAGALRGQRLAFGLDGDPTTRRLDLPAESFAAGPYGRVILVGSDDGTTSRLEALDIAAGCAWSVADERSVIRRATIDPSGSQIYEMRVDRASRADLGVWLRAIDGQAPARRILPPAARDARFGATWSTEFTWDVTGDRLAVQSCGEIACRTRVLSPHGGPIITLDAPDLGGLVGLDGDRVVTYGACRGLPARSSPRTWSRVDAGRSRAPPGPRCSCRHRSVPGSCSRSHRPPVMAFGRSRSTADRPSTSRRSRTTCDCSPPPPGPRLRPACPPVGSS